MSEQNRQIVFSNYRMVMLPWLSGMGETKRGGFVFYFSKLFFIVFCTSWRILFIFHSFSSIVSVWDAGKCHTLLGVAR